MKYEYDTQQTYDVVEYWIKIQKKMQTDTQRKCNYDAHV